jgi:hypothetical protein
MASILFFGGLTSSLGGGILSDKFREKSPDASSKICMYGSLIGLPFFLISVLTKNFWISISATAIRYLISETYWSPNITLLLQTVPSNKHGNV